MPMMDKIITDLNRNKNLGLVFPSDTCVDWCNNYDIASEIARNYQGKLIFQSERCFGQRKER